MIISYLCQESLQASKNCPWGKYQDPTYLDGACCSKHDNTVTNFLGFVYILQSRTEETQITKIIKRTKFLKDFQGQQIDFFF